MKYLDITINNFAGLVNTSVSQASFVVEIFRELGVNLRMLRSKGVKDEDFSSKMGTPIRYFSDV